MSATAIGLIVFALVFGSALLAIYVQPALPEHHLSAESKDVVKLGIALIATMSALVLSLLVASAKSAYDTRSGQLVQVAADIILLDRALARYGPETKDARSVLQRAVAATVERFWPTEGAKVIAIDPNPSPVEALYDKVEALSPQSVAQRAMQSQAQSFGRGCKPDALAAVRKFRQLDPLPVPGGLGILAVHYLCKLRALCSEKCNRDRRPLRLCAIRCRCDLSDPRARPIVRGTASGFQRSAARRVGPAGPVKIEEGNDLRMPGIC